MSAEARPEELPLGLVEVEPDGTVLYYNRDRRGASEGLAPEMVGRNFFAEVMPAGPGELLRGVVRHFLGTQAAAGSHRLTLARGGGHTHVRVLLARIRRRASGRNPDSVLMHLREEIAQ